MLSFRKVMMEIFPCILLFILLFTICINSCKEHCVCYCGVVPLSYGGGYQCLCYLRSANSLHSNGAGKDFAQASQSCGGWQCLGALQEGGDVVLGSRDQTQVTQAVVRQCGAFANRGQGHIAETTWCWRCRLEMWQQNHLQMNHPWRWD